MNRNVSSSTSRFAAALALSVLLGGLPSAAQAQAQRTAQSRQLEQVEQVKQWPSKAKRWALVIGVDNYKDGQISTLKGSANDARMLADALVRYAGFPVDQVVVMSTDQPEERQPTRVNILRRLSNLASVVPKDGLLLVSFAGHGIERNGQAYLLPSDAQISEDITFLEETAVSVTRMKERIRATGVNQVVVLLDACRNDPGGRADAPNPLTAAYTKFNFDVRNREVQAFATLYATAVGQRAYEYTEKRQGYFTWAIVEGLKGGAANEKGEVTLANLVKFVQDTVPKRIGIDLGAGKQQKPFAIIEGYRAEDLVIAVAGPESKLSPTSAPAADPTAVEISFWESIKNSNDPTDYQAYLDKYPAGQFAELAKRRAQPNGAGMNSAPMPTADQIIEGFIQASGIRAVSQTLKTLTLEGLMDVTVGSKTFTAKIQEYVKLPDKSLIIIVYEGGARVVETCDGTAGWIKSKEGLKSMSEHQLLATKLSLALITDVDQFKALYMRPQLKGKAKVGDREAYVIEVSLQDGKAETMYFDTETRLLIRKDSLFETATGLFVPAQTDYEDYVEVGGYKIPLTVRQSNRGSIAMIRFIDVKYNEPLEDKLFAKPK
jgi:Caspase domain